MRILTCKNHPALRYACKPQAWGPGGYNGSRNLFFFGTYLPERPYPYGHIKNGELVRECECPASDLVLAPEEGGKDA